MRLTLLHLLPLTRALQLPRLNFDAFLEALPITIDDYIRPNYTDTSPAAHELLRRQYSNTCPNNFHACNNLGAPGLCCADAAVCSADANGNVACCPTGAVCSGVITGIITAGTVNQQGSLISTTGTQTGSAAYAGTTTDALVPAVTSPTTTSGQLGGGTSTGGGFIIDGTSVVARPGRGARAADVPLFARAIIRALQYLPI